MMFIPETENFDEVDEFQQRNCDCESVCKTKGKKIQSVKF